MVVTKRTINVTCVCSSSTQHEEMIGIVALFDNNPRALTIWAIAV